MALQLKRNGITRVRPLQGGIEQWTSLRFPLEKLEVGGTGAGATPLPPRGAAPADPAAGD